MKEVCVDVLEEFVVNFQIQFYPVVFYAKITLEKNYFTLISLIRNLELYLCSILKPVDMRYLAFWVSVCVTTTIKTH